MFFVLIVNLPKRLYITLTILIWYRRGTFSTLYYTDHTVATLIKCGNKQAQGSMRISRAIFVRFMFISAKMLSLNSETYKRKQTHKASLLVLASINRGTFNLDCITNRKIDFMNSFALCLPLLHLKHYILYRRSRRKLYFHLRK